MMEAHLNLFLRKDSEKTQVRLKPAEAMLWLEDRISQLQKEKQKIAVGFAGRSCSGKTTIANNLANAHAGTSLLFSQDACYRPMTEVLANGWNFDQPEALKLDEYEDHLAHLMKGEPIEYDVYSRKNGKVEGKTKVAPRNLVVNEGLFPLMDRFADKFDIKVGVNVSLHGALTRRLLRDVKGGESSWTLLETTRYFLNVAEPMYKRHIEPTMKNADLIIENDYDPVIEAEKCNLTEAQRKYKAPAGINTLVENLPGVSLLQSSRQVDHYYTDGSFKDTGEIIRIREEGEAANPIIHFTYKGPKVVTENSSERQRLDFMVDPEAKQGILSAYKESSSVDKMRTLYSKKGVLFSIDSKVIKTEGGRESKLGDFIEIRESSGEAAVNELLSALGMDPSSAIKKSYSEM
ncbi:Uridine kinase [uncultured archaeon]|nr:Uridine kinase [uncultured archaeon]